MPSKRCSDQWGWQTVKSVPLKPNVCVSIIPCDNCSPWHVFWQEKDQVQQARRWSQSRSQFPFLEISWTSLSFRPRHTHAPCSVLATHLKGMAHTVQRSSTSGKRKAPPTSSSDPPAPSPKKPKISTARKSTGGHAPPKRVSGGQSGGCQHVSVLCYFTWMLTGIT